MSGIYFENYNRFPEYMTAGRTADHGMAIDIQSLNYSAYMAVSKRVDTSFASEASFESLPANSALTGNWNYGKRVYPCPTVPADNWKGSSMAAGLNFCPARVEEQGCG